LAKAGSLTTSIQSNSIEEAREITPEDVIEFLETLPKENYHCAELAVGVFYMALGDCQEHQRNPWKKLIPERIKQ
jgi:nitrogen fixation protein NifU and related proteins